MEAFPWEAAADLPTLRNEIKFLTWESVVEQRQAVTEPERGSEYASAALISEATPAILDAALSEAAGQEQNTAIKTI